MQVGTISGVWRYPVKSMGGEPLEAATLGLQGIPGDRGWAVYDETREGVTTAKRIAGLRACRARYVEEPAAGAASPPAEMTLPDGTAVRTDAPDAAPRLSALLGRRVGLRGLGPAGTDAAPRISSTGETEESLRAMMGLLPGEPMPDLSAFTPERLRAMRADNFFDAFPLHLLTRTTLDTLAGIAPESAWDVRRFRPNVFIEATQRHGYPEMDWIGRRLRVGGAVVEIVMGCPRCVMVTLAEDELPADPRVMRTLVRETRHTAGVYARVTAEGPVRPGDPVALAD